MKLGQEYLLKNNDVSIASVILTNFDFPRIWGRYEILKSFLDNQPEYAAKLKKYIKLFQQYDYTFEGTLLIYNYEDMTEYDWLTSGNWVLCTSDENECDKILCPIFHNESELTWQYKTA